MPHTSRPVGVTSHTTPLPAGEGLGEGPALGEASFYPHKKKDTLASVLK